MYLTVPDRRCGAARVWHADTERRRGGAQMATMELNAQQRTIVGKKVRKLRREGLVPAVVYGFGVEKPQPISLVSREIERAYVQMGKSAIIRLRVEGSPMRSVLIHDVQFDNTHRYVTHVDFLAPNMSEVMTVAVPLALVGEAPAVQTEDGILVQDLTEVQVSALPDQIPAALTLDVSHMTEIHAQITAGDLELPAGVTLVTPAEDVIVTVSQAQLVTEAEEPTATGAGAEDEAAVASGDADADESGGAHSPQE
jgi:large subunit ribosomal protein L25